MFSLRPRNNPVESDPSEGRAGLGDERPAAAAKILIVEDNALNLELAKAVLELAGYDILTAVSGELGIEKARSEQPALILMDIRMPGIDGLAATRLLKEDLRTRAIPIVALTAYAMKSDAELAKAAGCDGCLTKPIDTRQLALQVAKYLRAKPARNS